MAQAGFELSAIISCPSSTSFWVGPSLDSAPTMKVWGRARRFRCSLEKF